MAAMGLRGGVDGKGDGQSCLWWSQACSIGCESCATVTAGTSPLAGNPPVAGKIGFRKRYCNSSFQATLPHHVRPPTSNRTSPALWMPRPVVSPWARRGMPDHMMRSRAGHQHPAPIPVATPGPKFRKM